MTVSLVTGGAGYFGSLLAQHLLDAGDDVRVLDVNRPDDLRDHVEFVGADIRDAGAVDRAVAGVDRVFHNVAQVPLSNDEHLLRSVNVDGTRNLLDAAARAGVGKVVHTSSSAVFGVPRVNPVLPTTVPNPMEPYGHAKLAAEWTCLDAVRGGLDVTIIRPRTILGHGRLGIFGILFDWIADGADPIVLGEGSNRYQFVHADDLARACDAAAASAGPSIVNVGADRFGTMYEALHSLCDHAGTGAQVRRLPAGVTELAMRWSSRLGLTPFAPYHWLMYSKSMWFDVEPAVAALDWTPRWSTDEMITDSYDWFIEHRAEIPGDQVSEHRRISPQGVLSIAKRLTGMLPRATGAHT